MGWCCVCGQRLIFGIMCYTLVVIGGFMTDRKQRQPSKIQYPGYVYILDYGDGKTFKIGHTTKEPEDRLKQISLSSVLMPMRLVMSVFCENCKQLENLLHLVYDENNVVGEWYALHLVDIIEIYQSMSVFGGAELYDGWYELADGRFDDLIHEGVVGSNLPRTQRPHIIDNLMRQDRVYG